MSKKINDGLTTSQRYRLKHKDTDEYKKRQTETQKRWRANNSERAKEISREHYARNKEQKREEAASRFQRFKENGYSDRRRETQRVNCHNRRTAAKCDNPLTNEQWNGILCGSDHKCCKCGNREDLTIDHIIPVSRGGLHTANNVQVLCRSCNSSKGVKCG